MSFDSSDQVYLLILAAVGVHVVVLLLWRWFNPVYLLCAAFVLVSSIGELTGRLSVDMWLNRGRIYILALMTVLGLFLARGRLLRGACVTTLLFFAAMLGASCYSEYPDVALKARLFSLTTLAAGMALGLTIKDVTQLRQGIRVQLIPIAGAMVTLLSAIPGMQLRHRLDVFGMNPNMIGIVASGCLCLTVYLAVWDKAKVVRLASAALTVGLAVVLAASGSRGAFGATLLSSLVICGPLLMRPGRLFVSILLLGAGLWLVFSHADIEGSERLTQWQMSTGRTELWARLLEYRSGSPWIGEGALFNITNLQLRVRNSHSIYVQVFIELGLLGSALFVAAVLHSGWRGLQVVKRVSVPEKWLACAMIVYPLVVGGAESSPLLGLALPTLWWGMGLGLLERLDQLATSGSVVPAPAESIDWTLREQPSVEALW